VAPIAFLLRLMGFGRPHELVEPPVEVAVPPRPVPEPAPVTSVACPNCAAVLDPPPDHSRLCPRCRRPIVVRHVEGRTVYLTEAAVEIFEAERQRELDEKRWAHERRSWLQLAQVTGVPADRRRHVAATPLTATSVQSARRLYLAAAERAVRAARRNRRWDEVAQIRRRQAAALYAEAGATPPPPDEIVALHREGVAATLRKIAEVSREAELVAARCCPACRADNGRVCRIADELRKPRLPHTDCPRGLCTCDWWPVVASSPTKRRRRRATQAHAAVAQDAAAAGPDGGGAAADTVPVASLADEDTSETSAS
jgi:uncharacterized Zn finger protein (UPF0148 family)